MNRRSVRGLRVLGAIGSALVALVLAHSLVFLVRYGSLYGEALAHSGHNLTWTIAVVSAIGLGLGLAFAGIVQLGRLARAARARGPAAPSDIGPGLGRRWFSASVWLTATTGVLLTIQENVERATVGLPTPGIGLLMSAEYPWALSIVAAVAVALGLVIALFRWRRDELVARLRAAREVAPRAAAVPTPAWIPLRPLASVLGRGQGLRAPPSALPI